jgi:two-component system sensor histidine kinase KdpD
VCGKPNGCETEAVPTTDPYPTDPRRKGSLTRRALSSRRRLTAWLLTAALLPATVAIAEKAPLGTSLTSALLVLLLEAVVIAAIGGFVVAVVAALAAVLLANWFLVPPYRTLVVQSTDDLVALVVFLAVTLAASALVESLARARTLATSAGAEAEALRDSVDTPAEEADPRAVLDRIRSTFGMTRVDQIGRASCRERVYRAV